MNEKEVSFNEVKKDDNVETDITVTNFSGQHSPKPCPTCGTCPTCGNRPRQSYPYYPTPYRPWWNQQPYTYYPPLVTSGGTNYKHTNLFEYGSNT